ncbi:hypothetical protein [Variovorax rhizosphaerae]|uniref:Uncharacterized protein n=1 Tax=Variovorax rhizosphaerae TaxID=1836200 RepID=A0ABU8WYA5_9BURK
MNAIKLARRKIAADPTSESCRTLAKLVLALESDQDFKIADLYTLDMKSFELALAILSEWRLDRYIQGKAKLFDMSHQVRDMSLS